MGTGTSTTSISFNHTIGGGANRLLVVCIATEDGSAGGYDVTDVSYAGVSLTQAVEHSLGTTTYENTEIWYALEATLPTAGSYNITVTAPGDPNELEAGAVSFTGVAQRGPEATAFNDDGEAGDTVISQSITTLTDGAYVVDCVGSGNPGDFTEDPGQTEFFDATTATSTGAGSYEEVASAGAELQGFTFNGTGVRLSYVLAAFAPAVRSVYYSVGTSGANLMNGPTSLTISNGIATFTLDQPNDVGVGDEILYGGKTAYISQRFSARIYAVTDAVGFPAGDEVAPVGVTSILRAFNDLNEAQNQSSDVSHLNTTDLAGNDVQLNWACYDDSPLTASPSNFWVVRVLGWTTAVDSYIRIFAPHLPSEVGASQRHAGVAGTGFRIVPSVAATGSFNFLDLEVPHVRVEGIELDGSNVNNATAMNGVTINTITTAGSDIRLDRLLIHNLANAGAGGFVRGVTMQDGNLRMSNSIMYALSNNSADPGSMVMGVELNESTATHFLHHNTLFNIKQTTAGGADANGIVQWSGNTTVKNTFVGDVISNAGGSFCFRGISTRSNNVSSDATAGAGGVTGQTAYGSYFVNPTAGFENLHLLSSSDSIWGIVGVDLTSDPKLPVAEDVDGERREPAGPDVGADEVAATPLYRSVGVNGAELSGGGLTVDVVGTTATLSGPAPANVGVGDVLQYQVGATFYVAFIHYRFSDQSFLVASASGGTPQAASGENVGIYRAYTSLFNWELGDENDTLDNTVENFDTSTNLVTSNTTMQVACYADGPDGPVTIDWSTGFKNYIRIFVPRSAGEVGVSQRHSGVWDDAKFRVVGPGLLISVSSPHVRIDGLQAHTNADTNDIAAIEFMGSTEPSEYEVSNSIIRGFPTGLQDIRIGINLWASDTGVLRAWNNIIYDFDSDPGSISVGGIIPDDAEFTFYLYNNTIVDNFYGIQSLNGTVIAKNNLVYRSSFSDYSGSFDASSSHNVGGPAVNFVPGSSQYPGSTVTFLNSPTDDFHLAPADTGAKDRGVNLSGDANLSFAGDIDPALRQSPWDIGADDVLAVTAVELVRFEANATDGAVDLTWETGSEMDNLGFHLYRAVDPSGPFERITSQLLPGLGSSPEGARYRYRDDGLQNETTYYYLLEDVETSGATERHGPVSAMPSPDGTTNGGGSEPTAPGAGTITYGTPEANALRVVRRGPRRLVVELTTAGFYAVPHEDGTLSISLPDSVEVEAAGGGLAIPVKRPWLEALGAKAHIVSARAVESETIEGFPLGAPDSRDILALFDGTVRPVRGTTRGALRRTSGVFPETAARILESGFQGDVPKLQLELAPLRWDGSNHRLVVIRKLVVELAFERGGLAPPHRGRSRGAVVARLAVRRDGLYGLRLGDVPGLRSLPPGRLSDLRLTHAGEPVPFHLSGSALYFVDRQTSGNPYDDESVYELELSDALPQRMERIDARPYGTIVSEYVQTVEHEQNRLYQPTQSDLANLWTWEMLVAPQTKAYDFETNGLRAGSASALTLHVKGTSDLSVDPDHHVRVYVNGSFISESFWDGKGTHELEAEIPPGVLREGQNRLELEAAGDTGAAYSIWMLDRFAISYPRVAAASSYVEGTWRAGAATLAGLPRRQTVVAVDTTNEAPRWLDNVDVARNGTASFRAEEGHRYIVAASEHVLAPEVRYGGGSAEAALRRRTEGADYLLIGPRQFLDEAAPLLEQRASQGLHVAAVAMEDVYDVFGFGEKTPEALREFLRFAYHEWPAPALRYVVLFGDGTYDFKDYLQAGSTNLVPPYLVRTAFLWTASDPTLAAVNGDDVLPDVAIGRLPAANEAEARAMVEKVLAFERYPSFTGELVLVADNGDSAGDFRANAEDIASTVLAGRGVKKLYLQTLGAAALRSDVHDTFDQGASLVSYIGHGGIHVWGAEGILEVASVPSLSYQSEQPLLVTMNCLNGYFHFPYADSLSEALLKAEGRGAVAAFSPTGLSFDHEAHLFHKALLDAVFNGSHERLGDAILAAQSVYTATGAEPELLRIYHLLGDPALVIR